MSQRVPLSVLDFAPVRAGETPRNAIEQTVELARYVEALGFKRFWLAEHHGSSASASAATSVLIGHIAGQTSTIRVGAGGVMLPNHPPLVIAEQFGTLASLYPGRIDLGLGRASGAADNIVPALRLRPGARDHFPADVQELQGFFREPLPGQGPRAVPGAGLDVPIWLLGSSTHSAEQAAAFGLSYAFARYIAPDKVDAAIAIYRSNFRPSEGLDRAHVMIGVFIVAAETDEVARYLFTSTQQAVLEMRRGEVGPLRPPIQNLDAIASPEEMTYLDGTLRSAIVGSRETVRRGIEALISETEADELIVLALIHDQDARRRSFAIIAEARDAIAAKTRASYR